LYPKGNNFQRNFTKSGKGGPFFKS
jgi:hypothetical protein